MRFTQRIRSELVANREERPHARQRVRREPFGVYRPLTEASKMHLEDVLLGAQKDINRYAYWKDGAQFVMPSDFGVTFVTRRAIARAMIGGSLQRGFNPVQFRRRVQAEPVLRDSTLEVPLSHLDWFGMGGRKLVTRLAPSIEHMELLEQSDKVAELLEETGAEITDIPEPNHLTLYMFGTGKDFGTAERRQHNRLNERQQTDIAEIVQTHLDNAQIGSLALGGVVVGNNYREQQAFSAAG